MILLTKATVRAPVMYRSATQPFGHAKKSRPLCANENRSDQKRGQSRKSHLQSGQAYAPEKILKALIRAVSVKNRVDREVSHPNSVIFIGGLQPFECVLFLI